MARPVRQIRIEQPSGPILQEDYRPLDSLLMKQAFNTLHVGFAVVPIVAGIDKFFHLLVNWDQYLAPVIPQIIGIDAYSLMLLVGVIEICAGIGVALKPKIFAYVVSAWMVGIIVNLLVLGEYFDIVLRDLGLAVGAFALGKLSQVFDRGVKRQPLSLATRPRIQHTSSVGDPPVVI